MLIALALLILGLGGGDDIWLFPEDFKNRIERVVQDETRQTAILDLYEKMDESIATYKEHIKEFAEDVSKQNKNYENTERDFEKILQSALQKRKSMQIKLLNARMEMVELIEVDEWKKVFSNDSSTKDE